METINDKTSQKEIHRKAALAAGKKYKEQVHPNPQKMAEDLITKWSEASSMDNLPLKVRKEVKKRIRHRKNKITKALRSTGIADKNPITEEELSVALKRGKSTVPGEDGITYAVVRFLTTVEGNPVLKLYNFFGKKGNYLKHGKGR